MAKGAVEKRKPKGALDYFSLAITTFGVGYIPGAPGTYGSLVAIGFYSVIASTFMALRYTAGPAPQDSPESVVAALHAVILVGLVLFMLLGIWAADRSVELLGNSDASEAVVDEVMGQLVVFLFIPFTSSWLLIGAGFVLFRLFDIWKPYPIDNLQSLSGGIGVCADDLLAGVYAGVCLSIIYAITLSI
ncbi:MAG TPA: phosphatidylglycerophosphatase A [Pyrinomonadaceae bacterium]|nr:phosphatidylglycerophosphatase A [Pyrinomonadaceae bacterium]